MSNGTCNVLSIHVMGDSHARLLLELVLSHAIVPHPDAVHPQDRFSDLLQLGVHAFPVTPPPPPPPLFLLFTATCDGHALYMLPSSQLQPHGMPYNLQGCSIVATIEQLVGCMPDIIEG